MRRSGPRTIGMATILVLLLGMGCAAKSSTETASFRSQHRGESAFDSALAARLGADEYGMRPYVVALLRVGPTQSDDSATAMAMQRAHLEHIRRMADAGHLMLAGPFLEDGSLRGIYIFDVTSLDEARELTASDPAIRHGWLVMELHPWYGSAALREVRDIHRRIRQRDP